MPSRILIVDDERFYREWAKATLEHQGPYQVVDAAGVDDALNALEQHAFDLVIVDVRMPSGKAFTDLETSGGMITGLALARRVRRLIPAIKIIAQSQEVDHRVQRGLAGDERSRVIPKIYDQHSLLQSVEKALTPGGRRLRTFIVHGRDHEALLELKNFLQNGLGFPEPTVLREQVSGTATLLQKFEEHASLADAVLVLLTPDDLGSLAGTRQRAARRARQNAIFELGYFLCFSRQRRCPLIVLTKGELELPSDIAGLVTVDISDGVLSAGEEIRRELGISRSDDTANR